MARAQESPKWRLHGCNFHSIFQRQSRPLGNVFDGQTCPRICSILYPLSQRCVIVLRPTCSISTSEPHSNPQECFSLIFTPVRGAVTMLRMQKGNKERAHNEITQRNLFILVTVRLFISSIIARDKGHLNLTGLPDRTSGHLICIFLFVIQLTKWKH